MTNEEAVRFTSEGLRLEGRLSVPDGATRAAVFCHPHPQYGGSMDNNVVSTAVAALRRQGVATLRFNFRGVGGSEGGYANGTGEAADAKAAIGLLRNETGLERVDLGGYSFGAMIALLGHAHAEVERLIAVAPPLSFFDLGFLVHCRKPKLIVVGDRDEYCPYDAFEKAVESLSEPIVTRTVEGADHFFFGFEAEIADAVGSFVPRGAA